MHRSTPTHTLFLLLLTIFNHNPLHAHEYPSLRHTPSQQILQDVNNSTNATNATVVPDAGGNITVPTAAPVPHTPDVAPAPVPTPAEPTTHEPTKRYEPEDDDKDDEEGENHSAFAKGVLISVLSIFVLGILCYFRDAITFFVGTVSCDRIVYFFSISNDILGYSSYSL